ncbi:MAG: hypothetical protein V4598_04985 [Bdellovibrionota bacterium]
MRSLTITLAKGLQKGRVQMERYHLHVLRSVRETRNALHYVLLNQQKHEKPRRQPGTYSKIDDYSSVLCFKGGLDLVRSFAKRNRMTITIGKVSWVPDNPGSWLMKKGAEAPS